MGRVGDLETQELAGPIVESLGEFDWNLEYERTRIVRLVD
jgi:hypothetical protein